jgi:hypothetical protein
MTLNPAGAPACVRCNTPLATADPVPDRTAGPGPAPSPPDPTTGAEELGPGLAGAARAAPGSSRSAAAAVQPPGYGLDPPPAPPPPPGPSPADTRRARRRIAVAGLVLVALVLAGGGTALWLTRPRYLDTAAVGRTVGAELTARLGDRVTVECRGTPRRRAGETFRCTASDTRGVRQAVTVTVLDDAGRYRWELGS